MQKIVIKNFGAIEYAEIEIRKVLVLIGEQASGKSTIAKLIYFFKSLKENLKSESFLFAQEKIPKYTDIDTYFREFITRKFYDFFGYTLNFLNFEVRFYYSFQKNRYIQLNIDSHKNLCLIFSENFLDEQFKKGFADYINLSKIIDNSQKPYIKMDNLTQYSLSYQYLLQLLNNLFENKQEDLLFIIAGRNATVTYSDLFDKYLFASIQIDLKENREKSFANKLQMIDESLMLQFIEKVELIKRVLRKFSGFDGLINYQVNNKEEREYLKAIKSKINLILKGEYSIGNSEEKIIFKITG